MRTTRRSFLGGAASGLAVLPFGRAAGARVSRGPLRLGVCADPHQDIVHDGEERLRIFIEHMRRADVDGIVQLGDFCVPHERNDRFMEIWRRFEGPRWHVIGNHEVDGGYSRDDVVRYWGMPGRYYGFDAGGFHFVVLDGNDVRPGEPQRGYPRWVRDDQIRWLEADLQQTDAPTVVLIHQSLAKPQSGGVENAADVRRVLESARRADGSGKVVASFCGHHHTDDHAVIGGIHYVTVNSMSYYWLGRSYASVRYGEELDRAHPTEKFTAPYRDALYTTITFDPAGSIHMTGMASEWVGPSPWDLGYSRTELRDRVVPKIRERTLWF